MIRQSLISERTGVRNLRTVIISTKRDVTTHPSRIGFNLVALNSHPFISKIARSHGCPTYDRLFQMQINRIRKFSLSSICGSIFNYERKTVQILHIYHSTADKKIRDYFHRTDFLDEHRTLSKHGDSLVRVPFENLLRFAQKEFWLVEGDPSFTRYGTVCSFNCAWKDVPPGFIKKLESSVETLNDLSFLIGDFVLSNAFSEEKSSKQVWKS